LKRIVVTINMKVTEINYAMTNDHGNLQAILDCTTSHRFTRSTRTSDTLSPYCSKLFCRKCSVFPWCFRIFVHRSLILSFVYKTKPWWISNLVRVDDTFQEIFSEFPGGECREGAEIDLTSSLNWISVFIICSLFKIARLSDTHLNK